MLPVLGLGASLIKGSSDRKAAQKQADQQYSNDMAAAQQQREWYLEDREEARAYDRAELDETRQYSRQVLGQLVEDAEKAGFNPLTALRAGSGGSYNAAAGLAPLSSGGVVQRQAPVRQAVGGSAVGSAAGAVGDFLTNFDPFADQKKEQEYRLIESQISALNAGSLSGARRGAASFASGDFERRPSGVGGSLASRASSFTSGKNKPGEGTLVGGDDPTVSSLGLNDGRKGWFHAPWFPDAETTETIYGDNEIFSTIGGAVKFLGDAAYSAYRNAKTANDAYGTGRYTRAKKTKPEPKYRKKYFDEIREMVPSLGRAR